jgi:hypothetical protein
MAAKYNSLELTWKGEKRSLQSLVRDPAVNRHHLTWTTARRRLRTFQIDLLFTYPPRQGRRREDWT